MTRLTQLAIAIVAGIAASILIVVFDLARQPLLLSAVVLIASCITPLLSGRPAIASEPTRPPAADGREEGEVKWFNVSKGFGFIRRENGDEVFVHFRSIRDPAGANEEESKSQPGNGRRGGRERRALRDGQRVSFVVVDSDKGPQAEEVEAV